MAKRKEPERTITPRYFKSVEEIDHGIDKLRRRLGDLEQLDVMSAYRQRTGADEVVRSDIVETIRDVFGSNSPEFDEYEHLRIWAGPMSLNMAPDRIIASKQDGKVRAAGILNGLINRLLERREELERAGAIRAPAEQLAELDVHPRIRAVASQIFEDGHHWEAVFNASKALMNMVQERSGRFDLDGAKLMTQVFSKNNPVLAFSELSTQTELDEQEGMMHLFLGAVLAIRNPGGHSFPQGTPERALEYLELISLLAYRVEEAVRRKQA